MKPTVLIIDPNTLFGTGLASLLNEREFNAISYTPEEFHPHLKDIIKEMSPDVVIMEFRLEKNLGEEIIKGIRTLAPSIHIILLSFSEQDEDIIRSLKLGASAYLHKEITISEVVRAINTVMDKGYYVNEMVSGRLLMALRENNPAPSFTSKELKFLELCATELSYAEIGDVMDVSARTVDNYRAILFQKLNIKSRTGLVIYAIKNNLIKI